MPRALPWSADQDAEMMRYMDGKKRKTLQQVADLMGVSRSFVQRRAALLQRAAGGISTVAMVRYEAGNDPLAPGHALSVEPLVACVPEEFQAHPMGRREPLRTEMVRAALDAVMRRRLGLAVAG